MPYSRATGAITSAIAPVAAVIMAGRPPTNAIVTAMTNDENSPTLGSTPAMIEKEIASGISASATTRPARTSRVKIRGLFSAVSTEGSGRYRPRPSSVVVTVLMGRPPEREWVRYDIIERVSARRSAPDSTPLGAGSRDETRQNMQARNQP